MNEVLMEQLRRIGGRLVVSHREYGRLVRQQRSRLQLVDLGRNNFADSGEKKRTATAASKRGSATCVKIHSCFFGPKSRTQWPTGRREGTTQRHIQYISNRVKKIYFSRPLDSIIGCESKTVCSKTDIRIRAFNALLYL